MSDFNRKYCFVENNFAERLFKGLKEDLQLLYRHFLKKENLSFSSFATTWRYLKFTSIFAHRYLPLEALEYTEGVLHFSKGYIFSSDLRAVAFGIYFVYAVYNKQPLDFGGKYAKLRLTRNEFNDLKDRFNQLREKNLSDAAEIYLFMLRNSLILHVATPMQSGIEMGFRKYYDAEESQGVGSKIQSPDPLDPNLLDSYEHVLQLYEDKRTQVSGNSQLFSTESNFLQQMRKQLQDFGTARPEIITIASVAVDEAGQGSLRKNLKETAYAHGATTTTLWNQPLPRPLPGSQRKKEIKLEVKTEVETSVEIEAVDEVVGQGFNMDIFD